MYYGTKIEPNLKKQNNIKMSKKDKYDDLETAKKIHCNKTNVVIMTDYLVVATKTISIGTELKMRYNW